MRIGVISYTAKSSGLLILGEAAARLGVELVHFTPDAPVSLLQDSGLDAVIPRISPATIATVARAVQAAEAAGIYSTVPSEAVVSAFDKYETFKRLSGAGVATPYTEELDAEHISIAYPLLLKPKIANRGKGITLVPDKPALMALIAKKSVIPEAYIAQHYVEEAGNSDKRLFVIDGRVAAAMKRVAGQGAVTSNLSTGGTAKPYEPSEQEQVMAIRATQLFDCLFAGVDIIDTNEGPQVLEVNASPGFKVADVTGVDVAGEVLMAIARKGYNA